jgi:hypothetical protein
MTTNFPLVLSMTKTGTSVVGLQGNFHASNVESFANEDGSTSCEVARTGKAQPVYKLVGVIEPIPAEIDPTWVGRTVSTKEGASARIVYVAPKATQGQRVVALVANEMETYDVDGTFFTGGPSPMDLILPSKGGAKFRAVT